MPFSYKEGKDFIKRWLNNSQHSFGRVLDIGVGSGTYHRFFVKKFKILNNSHWTGIEVWEPYINKFKLSSKYHTIINEDIRKVDYSLLEDFDVTFAGDVLEHITKEDAIIVVDKILKKSKYLIISIPIIHFPQDETHGNPFEAHVKDDWSHEEMLETFPQIVEFNIGKSIGVYILTNEN